MTAVQNGSYHPTPEQHKVVLSCASAMVEFCRTVLPGVHEAMDATAIALTIMCDVCEQNGVTKEQFLHDWNAFFADRINAPKPERPKKMTGDTL